jgi:hypothetical protein
MSPSASNNDNELQASDYFPSSNVLDRKAVERLHVLLDYRPDPRTRRAALLVFRLITIFVRR